MKLLLTGATGVAGLAVYRAALVDPAVTHITILSRRAILSWAVLPPDAVEKTTVISHSDFLTYPQDLARSLAKNDACVWAMGKTAMGMGEEEYTTMTYEYPMAALRALKEGGVDGGQTKDTPFRFIYVSGESADPTQSSRQMWARVKGKAEVDIAEFCNTSASMKAHIIRPGYFFPSAKYPEDRKNQRSRVAGILDYALTPLFECAMPSLTVSTEELGRFAVELAKGRWPDQELFRNGQMRELVKQL